MVQLRVGREVVGKVGGLGLFISVECGDVFGGRGVGEGGVSIFFFFFGGDYFLVMVGGGGWHGIIIITIIIRC